jgi:hypothetical protein
MQEWSWCPPGSPPSGSQAPHSAGTPLPGSEAFAGRLSHCLLKTTTASKGAGRSRVPVGPALALSKTQMPQDSCKSASEQGGCSVAPHLWLQTLQTPRRTFECRHTTSANLPLCMDAPASEVIISRAAWWRVTGQSLTCRTNLFSCRLHLLVTEADLAQDSYSDTS